jgi:hypothetical protein
MTKVSTSYRDFEEYTLKIYANVTGNDAKEVPVNQGVK